MGRAHIPEGAPSTDCPGAGCNFPQPLLLPPVCQEVCDPLIGGSWDKSTKTEKVPENAILRLPSAAPSCNSTLVMPNYGNLVNVMQHTTDYK